MSAAHTAGPYTVHVVQVASPLIAAMELSQLVHGTKGFSGVLPMVVAANGLCVAVTGCGPDGEKNARAFSAMPDLLAAASEAESLIPHLIDLDKSKVASKVLSQLRAALAKATGATS